KDITPPPLPPSPATPPWPDGVGVPDIFNYSPGEDDSQWLSSLEREEEEKLKRTVDKNVGRGRKEEEKFR
ncbi:hypothetical protein XENOCAPTIV_029678, partial [Xenoophorus captivus]